MAWWKRSSQSAGDGPAAAEMPLIRLEGIGRVFEGDAEEPAVALRDVTVDIDRGEFISVSGPSGCGKSTFLSIIAMLDTPTTGRYWLSGRPVDKLSPNERARVRNVDIGLIFQSFNLIGDLSVFENVEYPLTLRNVGVNERRDRVMTALERQGLVEFREGRRDLVLADPAALAALAGGTG